MDERVPVNGGDWVRACGRGLVCGSSASLFSLAALLWLSRRQTGSPVSATNATSHWLWGDRALRRHRVSVRYTALGYLIHHASSVFWAVIYERWFSKGDRPVQVWRNAAAVAALACATDYLATPKRLTPGFEHHLPKAALAAVYVAFAAGLAVGQLLYRSAAQAFVRRAEAAPVQSRTLH